MAHILDGLSASKLLELRDEIDTRLPKQLRAECRQLQRLLDQINEKYGERHRARRKPKKRGGPSAIPKRTR